jgi:hypothetical protein
MDILMGVVSVCGVMWVSSNSSNMAPSRKKELSDLLQVKRQPGIQRQAAD